MIDVMDVSVSMVLQLNNLALVDERMTMLSSVKSTLHLANPASLNDLLIPSSVSATDFAVAEAIYSFISSTMSGFL